MAAPQVAGALEHGAAAAEPFLLLLTIFLLACFVGYYVVWNVTPALHSPLMGVTNAISSVIVVGAMLATGLGDSMAGQGLRLPGGDAGRREHLRRIPGDATNARHVPAEGLSERWRIPFPPSPTSSRRSSSSWRCGACRSPTTSRQGNLCGMIGMAIAVVATLAQPGMSGTGIGIVHRRAC